MFEKELKEYRKYLLSDYWMSIREQVIKRDGFMCTKCHVTEQLQVHHKSYEFVGNENIDGLITLCKKCHYKRHIINKDGTYFKYLLSKEIDSLQEEMMNICRFIYKNKEDLHKFKDYFNECHYMTTEDYERKIIDLYGKSFNLDMMVVLLNYELKFSEVIDYPDYLKEKYNLPQMNHNIILDKIHFKDDSLQFRYSHNYINVIPYRIKKLKKKK